jgi:hypothetical protein
MPFIDVPSYEEFEVLKSGRFRSLMDSATELKNDIAVLEAQLAEVKDEIDKELAEAEVTGSVMYNGWRVSVVNTEGRPKLDKKKLLRLLGAKGPSLFKQAMIPGVPKHYIQITSPKEKEDTDE